jgi:hypothetical protein
MRARMAMVLQQQKTLEESDAACWFNFSPDVVVGSSGVSESETTCG